MLRSAPQARNPFESGVLTVNARRAQDCELARKMYGISSHHSQQGFNNQQGFGQAPNGTNGSIRRISGPGVPVCFEYRLQHLNFCLVRPCCQSLLVSPAANKVCRLAGSQNAYRRTSRRTKRRAQGLSASIQEVIHVCMQFFTEVCVCASVRAC